MTRVVLDTNVVVSALLFEGRTAALHLMWRSGRFTLLASSDMIRELKRVLDYPKFKLTPDESAALLTEEILPFVTPVTVHHTPAVILEDPSDDIFLACATTGRADVIVSGDKHLLSLKHHKKIPILTAQKFLEHQ